MPSYAELAAWKDRNYDEFERYYQAVMDLYHSTGEGALEVHAAVDQTPAMVQSKAITRATLIAMGYGDAAVRAIVIAKVVEMRLTE